MRCIFPSITYFPTWHHIVWRTNNPPLLVSCRRRQFPRSFERLPLLNGWYGKVVQAQSCTQGIISNIAQSSTYVGCWCFPEKGRWRISTCMTIRRHKRRWTWVNLRSMDAISSSKSCLCCSPRLHIRVLMLDMECCSLVECFPGSRVQWVGDWHNDPRPWVLKGRSRRIEEDRRLLVLLPDIGWGDGWDQRTFSPTSCSHWP